MSPAVSPAAHLEDVLRTEYHYWLQRGTFEVQFGDLSLATNFLGQAHSLNPNDPLVATEHTEVDD